MIRLKRNAEKIAVMKQELLRILNEEDVRRKLMQTLLQAVLGRRDGRGLASRQK